MFQLRYICIMCLVIWGQLTIAQDVKHADKSMVHAGEGPVSVPFLMVNNLILIPVQINGSDTLQFIFDTGLENSIICELEGGEILELKHAREVLVRGIGSPGLVEAIQSEGNSLRVGDIRVQDQDYIIPSNSVLQLSSRMGTKIHGLLNMQAFQEYIIEIDYDRQCLTFYKPGYFREYKDLDGYTTLQMDVKNTIPFILASILTNDACFLPVTLMLDTGAGNALSLNTESMPGYSIPVINRDVKFGHGINGNIKGRVGRIKEVLIGPFQLHDVLVYYPDNQINTSNKEEGGHHGSLGAEFLRRFNMILDYPDKKIHIMKNSAFGDAFHYDMNGLEILAPDPFKHRYLIAGVRTQSKAELAGIRPGDEILSINGTPAIQLNLGEIYHNLFGNEGKKIRLELLRDGKKIRARFRLEKYI